MMKLKRMITAAITSIALTVSFAGFAQASEVHEVHTELVQDKSVASYEYELDAIELEKALQIIENIPDSALQSEQDFENWKQAYLSQQNGDRASFWGCTWGITKALVANVFVFSKIAKLKTVIKAAGGVNAVAQKAIKAYKAARAAGKKRSEAIAAASEAVAVNGGEQALSLVLEFFSLDSIVTGCFTD